MTLSNQALLSRVAVADTTSAVINTLKTTTILAAPAAGLRYRVYGVSVAFDLGTATPAGGSGILFQIVPAAGPYLSIIYQSQVSDRVHVPQGFSFGTAAALTLRSWPSVAVALAFVCSVLYVLETA